MNEYIIKYNTPDSVGVNNLPLTPYTIHSILDTSAINKLVFVKLFVFLVIAI